MGAKMFGARVARLEDPALLTGRGTFTDDIHLPGALEAAFVRSPHPHARIRAIDASAALRRMLCERSWPQAAMMSRPRGARMGAA